MCVCVCVARPVVSLGPAAGFREAPLFARTLLLLQEALSPRRRAASGPDTHGGGAQGGAAAHLRLRSASVPGQVGVLDSQFWSSRH